MAKKIKSDEIVPKETVSAVDVETTFEKYTRIYSKAAAHVLGFVFLTVGFGLCVYIVATGHEFRQQAWSLITTMIGGVFGYLYGTKMS